MTSADVAKVVIVAQRVTSGEVAKVGKFAQVAEEAEVAMARDGGKDREGYGCDGG